MNKKIAIITWHMFNNYGGVLQTYALRKKIKDLGYEIVDNIDYIPKERKKFFYKQIFTKSFYERILNRFYADRMNIKDKKFDEFRIKNITLTKVCKNKKDLNLLNSIYDKFICGSDQIWAPTIFDENYFLDFVENKEKKIAYAPSIGLEKIENEYIANEMKKLITDIPCLSVREEKGRDIIKNLTNREADIVLDPTLLLTKKEWHDLFNLSKFEKNDYILVYCLGDISKAYKLAKKFNKEIVIIPKNNIESSKYRTSTYIASPEEFLKLIYNASLVITDSFHGTAFSINFNIPFVVLKRFKDNSYSQNSRIYNILKAFRLENRLYKNKEFFLNTDMDFKECNRILDKRRKLSIDFLISSLKQDNKLENCKDSITTLCTGCGVCATACPQKCIEIVLNSDGFYEYKKDKTRCNDCNICKKVCAQISGENKNFNGKELYSFYTKDEKVLGLSSSGGFAYELAKKGLKNNYTVIGCAYDYDSHKAKHIVVNNEGELKKLIGSKYIQSYTLEAFEEIIKTNKAIVIGTPCQIASLHNYLTLLNRRKNFILVDLICHGVPSYLLWMKYLKTKKEKTDIRFRDKHFGWRIKTITTNGKKYEKEGNSLFYDFFSFENVYNKACYDCNYRESSMADIRIGDFWGPKFDKNKKGVSMVIACTELGKEIINELRKSDEYVCNIESIEDYFNWQQTKNYCMPVEREDILKELKDEKKSLKKISRKYCGIYKFDRYLLLNSKRVYRKMKSIFKLLARRKNK